MKVDNDKYIHLIFGKRTCNGDVVRFGGGGGLLSCGFRNQQDKFEVNCLNIQKR